MSDFLRAWREATALRRGELGRRAPDWAARPEPFKRYPDRPRRELPHPPFPVSDLWQALARRRSRRDFSAGPLAAEDLALLLWAAQGVTARHGPYHLRTAPSAGALYPFETYVSVQRMTGLSPALAHFSVPDFCLEVLRDGDAGGELAAAALGQHFLARAAAVVVWTAVPARAAWKYGDRAARYVGLDLGHACQNLALAAEALGLACCPVAAFVDAEVDAVLGVDGRDEFAYYLAGVAPPAEAPGG